MATERASGQPVDRQQASRTEQEWSTWHAFHLMRRGLDRALDLQLQRDYLVSAPEYEVLIALDRSPHRRLRVRDLARAMGWEKSRLSHQLTRMERRGLVERTTCETDARGSWIALTAEGRRTVLAAMRGHNTALGVLFFDQLDGDGERLLAFSGRVLAAIGVPVEEDFSDGGAHAPTNQGATVDNRAGQSHEAGHA